MKRKIIIALLIVVLYVLQTTVFQYLVLANVTPNLLIMFVASAAYIKGRKDGMWIGFISGFIIDCSSSFPLGTFALFYCVVGYLCGFLHREYAANDIKLPLFVIGASDILLNILIYVFLFVFRGRFNFSYYMLHIVIPEVVYTLVLAIPLYLLISKVNQKLDQAEKKGAVKFGAQDKELF